MYISILIQCMYTKYSEKKKSKKRVRCKALPNTVMSLYPPYNDWCQCTTFLIYAPVPVVKFTE